MTIDFDRPIYSGRSWINIDLDAYRHNIRVLLGTLKFGAGLMAVVKANAYGHGAVQVARIALEAGAQCVGVAFVQEGCVLRDAGIRAPILVLGPCLPQDMELGIQHDLTFSVSSEDEIRCLAEKTRAVHQGRNRGRRTKVHLLLDTGMGRAGFYPDEVWPAAECVLAEKTLDLEGIFTHFTSAEEPDGRITREQICLFRTLLRRLDERRVRFRLRHMANSASTVLYPESQLDLVRCGAILHGLRGWQAERDGLELIPTLSWRTRIVHLCKRPAGWTVGYNRRFRCPRESWLATLPAGYRDGFRRALTGRGEVLVGGQRVPVVGTISMDFIVVDVTALAQTPQGLPRIGDEAVLVGGSADGRGRITIEELAALSGTIPYVITTQLSVEVERRFVGEQARRLEERLQAEREQAEQAKAPVRVPLRALDASAAFGSRKRARAAGA